MKESKYDTRWAIIPGVLHCDATWGSGTTEYALDAIMCACQQKSYECPVDEKQYLPMIWITDLIIGLVALMDADSEKLKAPE